MLKHTFNFAYITIIYHKQKERKKPLSSVRVVLLQHSSGLSRCEFVHADIGRLHE